MDRPIEITYSKFTAILILSLILYMFYLTIEERAYYFGGVVISVLYMALANGFKTGLFKENTVVLKYPFRPFKRSENIDYHLIESVKTGSGSTAEGYLVIIRYRGKTKIHKRILEYPSNKTWEALSAFLKTKNVKVL